MLDNAVGLELISRCLIEIENFAQNLVRVLNNRRRRVTIADRGLGQLNRAGDQPQEIGAAYAKWKPGEAWNITREELEAEAAGLAPGSVVRTNSGRNLRTSVHPFSKALQLRADGGSVVTASGSTVKVACGTSVACAGGSSGRRCWRDGWPSGAPTSPSFVTTQATGGSGGSVHPGELE